MRCLVVVVVLSACGPAREFEAFRVAPAADAGACVPCEGEDGAQFAESTLSWAPVTCQPTCP